MSMKAARQKKILELIAQHPIYRQEDLMEKLGESGYEVTQATVSRDIRELHLVKASTPQGGYRYMPAAAPGKSVQAVSRFETIFRESVIRVDSAGNIVLVQCYSGMANAACELFDGMTWQNVVGTLSGDDTFFVLVRSEEAARQLVADLEKYIQS